MFARRGFNIESLAVGPTERHDVSRIVLTVDCPAHLLEQIEKQMHKLVNVLRVSTLQPGEAVERELALVRVSADPSSRAELIALADVFDARVADLGPDSMVFEVVGTPEQLESFEELLRPHGLIELARTGRIGLARASTNRSPRPQHVLQIGKESSWPQPSIAKATSISSPARWPSSATAARATRMRSTCATPASTSRSGSGEGSSSWAAAEEAGLTVKTFAEAVRGAQLVAVLLPDHVQKGVYERDVAPNLEPDAAVLFAHGFNVHFGQIAARAGARRDHGRPQGARAPRPRSSSRPARASPALVAVAQDASGNALDLALAYGTAIGSGRMGMIETTFAEETESDLFGEQAVLCGGVCALMQAGFEILVDAGYQPEIAYYECINEMKLIVDLIYEGGFGHMRNSISDVAEYGDLTRGQLVIDEHVRTNMQQLLEDVRNGSFARELIAEEEAGRPRMTALRRMAARHPVESVGAELRELAGREGLLGTEAGVPS